MRISNVISYADFSIKRANSQILNKPKSKVNYPCLLNSTCVIPFNISFGSGADLLRDFDRSEESYIDFISNIDDTSQNIRSFLSLVLNDEDRRDNFIEQITENPRKSQKNVSILQEKLGGKEGFLKWYLASDGYVKNYEKFLAKKYKNAKSVEELVKFQPNWGYWALERKQSSIQGNSFLADILMRDRKISFTLGKLPEEFGSNYSFRSLIDSLKESSWMPKHKDIRCGGTYFNVTQLDGGDLSSKNIYLVNASGKKFILKMDRFYYEDKLESCGNPYYSRTAKEAKLLRGDSVYLDACIDYYLQSNNCISNAKMLYYDFDKDASIYEYIEADELKNKSNSGLMGQIEANRLIKGANKLGVYFNDISTSFNCYKTQKGDIKVIDVGHSEYIDLLKPGKNLLTIETSNLCGFSLKNALAGLSISTLNNISSPYSIADEYKNDPEKAKELRVFAFQKKSIKTELKENLQDAIEKYGSSSSEAIDARFKLLNFYKKNLCARMMGYLSDDKKDIKGILRAMRREISEIRESSHKDNSIYEMLSDYQAFIDEAEESLL